MTRAILPLGLVIAVLAACSTGPREYEEIRSFAPVSPTNTRLTNTVRKPGHTEVGRLGLERLMLDLINDERKARSLNPLKLELRLNKASEDHNDWMLDTDNFSHTGRGGSNPGDRMRGAGFKFAGRWTWAENIAIQTERGDPGLVDDVADLHQTLMNSAGHRANILNPNFEVIGISIEQGEYKDWDGVIVTQNFARTEAAVRLN
jgi:serralysin